MMGMDMGPSAQFADLSPMSGSPSQQQQNPLVNLANRGRYGSMRRAQWGPGNPLWHLATGNSMNQDASGYNLMYGGRFGGGVSQTMQRPSYPFWSLMKMYADPTLDPSVQQQRFSYGMR